jgi:hypothetical protein
MGYDLIVSLQKHDQNEDAIDLVGKILTLVDGNGKGQSGTITGYQSEYKEYTLTPSATWSTPPDQNTLYEITALLSNETAGADTPYSDQLGQHPVTDDYVVVLTGPPAADTTVVIDVKPAPTRTLNSDEIFNPDAGFGQANEVQVRAATNRALIELRGGVKTGEIWVLNLTGLSATLGVDALMGYTLTDARADLADDGILNGTYARTGNTTILYATTGTDTLTSVGDVFAISVDGATEDITVNHTVATGQSLTDVANVLAGKINSQSSYDAAVEIVDGVVTILISGAGTDGTTDAARFEVNVGVTGTAVGGTATAAETPLLLVTSKASGDRFYANFAITPDTRGGFSANKTFTNAADPEELEVELTGFVSAGETWTLKVGGTTYATYLTQFRDDLSTIARAFYAQLIANSAFTNQYDVIQRGRIITLTNATDSNTNSIPAVQVTISPDSAGSADITPQLEFTTANWNVPQTVTLQAIDDTFIDGGDALVFPAFEERVNSIRGPLTVRGGTLAGAEQFLNDPFRLPEETNERQPDGTVDEAITNLDGDAVLTDRDAFHFNALLGERPGFDPRMNDFPFEVTFLDGPGNGTFLDVKSVSKELLSFANDQPFSIDLTIGTLTKSQLGQRIIFSGTPQQSRGVVTNTNLTWNEVVVSLTGTAVQEENWSVTLVDSHGRPAVAGPHRPRARRADQRRRRVRGRGLRRHPLQQQAAHPREEPGRRHRLQGECIDR